MDDAVHVAAVNADDRRPAGLGLERHQAEGLLHTRMHEKIGGAVERGEARRFATVIQPGHGIGGALQSQQFGALEAVADDEEVEPPRVLLGEVAEARKERLAVFFSCARRPT